jgi:hypothetical protein
MGKMVCTGALMSCSMGTSSSAFQATKTNVIGPTAAGVITDFDLASIPPFGLCQSLNNPQVAAATAAEHGVLTRQPCTPLIAGAWTPGSAKVTIGEVPALDDSSNCVCSWGGTITVSSPGQENTTVQ